MAAIILSAVVSGLFIHSVALRKPWHGTLFTPCHIHPTAKALFYSRAWLAEGAVHLKFASVQNIHSVETGNYYPNWFYVSLPPGYLVPIYLTALITGKTPSPASIMTVNLSYHLACSILLALGLFFLLLQAGIRRMTATLIAIVPSVLFLFTTGTLWYMQVVYYSNQPGVFLFVIYIFLVIIRRDIHRSFLARIVDVLQFLVIFAGVLTDYLFYLVALVAFFIRLLNREISGKPRVFLRRCLVFWSPVLLGSLLFLWQIFSLKAFPQLVSRAQVRTGRSGGVDLLISRFWNEHLALSFGKTGRVLILLSIVLAVVLFAAAVINRIRGKYSGDSVPNRILSVGFLAIFPQVLYVFALKNAHAQHSFFTLPFAVSLALFPMAIFAVLVWLYLQRLHKVYSNCRSSDSAIGTKRLLHRGFPFILAVFLLAVAVRYAVAEKNRMKVLFTPRSTVVESAKQERIYRFIGSHTGYDDVVFSPSMEVGYKNPVPQLLAGNNIYKLYSPHDIFYRVRYIRSAFNVCMVIDKRFAMPSWLHPLFEGAVVTGNGEVDIFRLEGRSFLERYLSTSPPTGFEDYLSEWLEFVRNRNQLGRRLSRNDFNGALDILGNMLGFLEKHDVMAFNTRYLIAEMGVLGILNRQEEAAQRLARLRHFKIVPERHLMWGWDPDPHLLTLIRLDPLVAKLMIRGRDIDQ